MTGAPLSGVGPVTMAGISVNRDVRAHAHHFAGVQVAVLEDRFADVRYAVRLRGERHELRLHVGGEAGIFLGGHVGGDQLFRGAHAQARLSLAADFHAAFPELVDDGGQMLRLAVREQQFAAGDRAGDEERARLDAVGNNGVRGAVQLSTPCTRIVGVPAPSIFAPILTSSSARSGISGSSAQFSRTVSPSASTAAVRIFSVPVTVIFGKAERRRRAGASARAST